MKTYEDIVKLLAEDPACLDSRDLNRLCYFINAEDVINALKLNDEESKELKDTHKPVPYTRENVINCLRSDVEFAFEKALCKRGISSSFMFEVIKMWNNILEEGLENWPDSDYAQYGLPLFKATALKYGFDNPIGEDTGSEFKYSS